MSNLIRGNSRGRGRGRGNNTRFFPRNLNNPVAFYGPQRFYQQVYDAPPAQYSANMPPPPQIPPGTPQQQQQPVYMHQYVNDAPQPYVPPTMPYSTNPSLLGYHPGTPEMQFFNPQTGPPMMPMMMPNQENVYPPAHQPPNDNYYLNGEMFYPPSNQPTAQTPQIHNNFVHENRDSHLGEVIQPTAPLANPLASSEPVDSDISVEDPQDSRSPSPEIQPVADGPNVEVRQAEESPEVEPSLNHLQIAPIVVQLFREPIICQTGFPMTCKCGGLNTGSEGNTESVMKPSLTVQVKPGGGVVLGDEQGEHQTRRTSALCDYTQVITITHHIEMNRPANVEVHELVGGGDSEIPEEIRTMVQMEEFEEEDLDSFHDAVENFGRIEIVCGTPTGVLPQPQPSTLLFEMDLVKEEVSAKKEALAEKEPLAEEEQSTSNGKTENSENVASNSKPKRKRSNNKKRNNRK